MLKPEYWTNFAIFQIYIFGFILCLFLHRLTVRICLPFYNKLRGKLFKREGKDSARSRRFKLEGKGTVRGKCFKREGKGSMLGRCFKREGKGSVLGRRFNWKGKG